MTRFERSAQNTSRSRSGALSLVATGMIAASLAGLAGALPANAVTGNQAPGIGPGPGIAPAPGLRIVPSVVVPADQREVGTGKFFTVGEQIRLFSTGHAVYGNDTVRGVSALFGAKPDGVRSLGDDVVYAPKYDAGAKLPSAPVGALIGRVGNSGWFLIGSTYQGDASTAGELVLSVNDIDGLRGDNSGHHTVYSNSSSTSVTVQANRETQTPDTTGTLDLKTGDTVSVSSYGDVTYAGGLHGVAVSPDGRQHAADRSPKFNPSATLPGAPLGALIGRIGTGPYFLIGNGTQFTTATEGTLSLQTNDIPGGYTDNHGTVNAHIDTYRAFTR